MPAVQSQDGETREFVVLLPEGELFDALPKQREISEAFRRWFPDMKFTLQPPGAKRVQHGVCIFPILDATESDRSMLKWPSPDLVVAILSCLAGSIVQAGSATKPNLH